MSCCVVAPAKPTAAASRATHLPVQQGASGGEMRVILHNPLRPGFIKENKTDYTPLEWGRLTAYPKKN